MSIRSIPKRFLSLVCLFLFAGSLLVRGQQDIKVLITSPQGYSERFKKEFSSSHLIPVPIPMIETVIPDELPDMDKLFANLTRYDYIAFSSRKAIESFAVKMAQYPDIQKHLHKLKFCAIGKDAEYMYEKLHVSNAIHPEEASPIGIANKLAEQPGITKQSIAVLVPRVEKVKEPDVVPNFLARLQEIGLKVTRIHAYTTRPVADEKIKTAADLILSGKVNCVAFTSGTEIEGLLRGFPDKQLPPNVAVACFGPYTAGYAKKIGIKVDLVAKNFSSFTGFIQAIKEYYEREGYKR